MAENKNLQHAKAAKFDEFYTQYRSQLKGKVIYCNCDDPTLSLKELVSIGKDIITILRNNIFTHMNINSVCALGGVV